MAAARTAIGNRSASDSQASSEATPVGPAGWALRTVEENLPAPAVIAQEIVEDPQAALEQFAAIAEDLR